MPYNPLIPQANDRIRDSQPAILENFTVINRAFDINHVSFDDADEGKHKHVTFPEQGADPATAVNEVAIYAKQSALIGDAALFLRKENSGTVYEWTSAVLAQEGWTRTPSGVILKWGWVNNPGTGAGNKTFALPVAGNTPVFSNIYTVLVSTKNGGANDFVRLVSFTVANITVYVSNNNPQISYLAIGSDL